ncbi:MAG: hypothetical protein N3F05_00035 [Candidatus Diapherotrites archaeon]|nr:hypothetical protein [Candidatus Diapherotrites archaeon]
MDVISKSFQEYKSNFKICLLFALLLAFVPVFIIPFFRVPFFETGITLSSGTILIDYMLSTQAIPIFILALVFLFFYSFLIGLICLAVRRDLSKVKVHFYLKEMVSKFAFKIFGFYAIILALVFIPALILSSISLNLLVAFLVFVFIISIFFMFVPQAIVIDEVSLETALAESASFVRKNPVIALKVVFLMAALLLLVGLIEFILDMVALTGVFGSLVASEFIVGQVISIAITLVFVVPFIEILKTFFYMLKFDLIKRQVLIK